MSYLLTVKKYKPATVNRKLASLRQLLGWLPADQPCSSQVADAEGSQTDRQ